MKQFRVTAAALAMALTGSMAMGAMGSAQAAQGDWLARARIIDIDPDARSSALNIDVNSKIAPELDFSYFVTNNIALELILATRKHDVSAGGVNVGSVKHLPPTLTVQYHFLPDQRFRPYVGAGLNYTRFYDVNLAGGALTVDKSSWGPAVQVGMDIEITKRVFVNLDVKKIWMDTDVKSVATGATVANLKIDPWVFGIGIGIKF
jgi:outer membrane protein